MTHIHNRSTAQRRRLSRSAGVTLIELLVTVVIVGILASIAIPSYTQYVTRTNRTIAKTVLMQVADRQEQFFANNKRYASDLTNLGYPADGFMIDDNGTPVDAGSPDRLYVVSLAASTAVTYTLSAAPQLRQATRDTECQTLTLAHTGVRSQTGSGTNCW